MPLVYDDIVESMPAPVAEPHVITVPEVTTPGGYKLRMFDAPDPFILFQDLVGIGEGVPPHPHVGIEAVTYMLEGSLHHRASRGAAATLGPGGVRVVVTGSGVIHTEEHVGPAIRGFQLWVNLDDKSEAPRIHESEIGADGDIAAVAPSSTPLLYKHLRMVPDGARRVAVDTAYNVCAYVIGGTARVQGLVATNGQAVFLGTGHQLVDVECLGGDAEVLLLGGKPLGRLVARHQGMVGDSKDDIMSAYRKYYMGRLGSLQ